MIRCFVDCPAHSTFLTYVVMFIARYTNNLLDIRSQLLPNPLQRRIRGHLNRSAGNKVHVAIIDHLTLLHKFVAEEKDREEGNREVSGHECGGVEVVDCFVNRLF